MCGTTPGCTTRGSFARRPLAQQIAFSHAGHVADGLDDGVAKTMVTAGRIAGLKTPRVQSLEKSALKKLRRPVVLERIRGFLDESA